LQFLSPDKFAHLSLIGPLFYRGSDESKAKLLTFKAGERNEQGKSSSYGGRLTPALSIADEGTS
jgi:hypothetical protein